MENIFVAFLTTLSYQLGVEELFIPGSETRHRHPHFFLGIDFCNILLFLCGKIHITEFAIGNTFKCKT